MTAAEQAAQVWQVLAAAAHHRQTLTYRLLGERIGLAPDALAPPLALIGQYCNAKQLPPLTVLVVRAGDGRPGPEFVWATDPDGAREAVYEHAWHQRRPPTPSDFELIERLGIGTRTV